MSSIAITAVVPNLFCGSNTPRAPQNTLVFLGYPLLNPNMIFNRPSWVSLKKRPSWMELNTPRSEHGNEEIGFAPETVASAEHANETLFISSSLLIESTNLFVDVLIVDVWVCGCVNVSMK